MFTDYKTKRNRLFQSLDSSDFLSSSYLDGTDYKVWKNHTSKNYNWIIEAIMISFTFFFTLAVLEVILTLINH